MIKFQITKQFRILVIGVWILFVFWYLVLGIYPDPSRGVVSAQVDQEFLGLNDQINTKKEELSDIQASIGEYQSKIKSARRKSFSLEREIAILSNRIAKTKLDIKAAEIELETLGYEIQLTEAEILVKQEKQDKQKQILVQLIRKIHKYDQKSQLEILLLNNSFSEFFGQVQYLESIENNLARSLGQLKILASELEAKQSELEAQKDLTIKSQETLERKRVQLEGELTAKEVLIGETFSSENRFQSLVFELRQEQRRVDEDIANLKGVISDKLREKDISWEGGTVILSWPVPNRTITAYFHDPEYPFKYIFEHPAIDIRASQGTSIKAVAPGYVLRTRDGGYGYSYLVVAHAGGISTVYGHVSKIIVEEGAFVSRGQVIALSGGMPGTKGAGRLTTGPHLHFETRLNGIPVNPLDYLFSY